VKVIKNFKFKLDFKTDDDYSYVGNGMELGEATARELYAGLKEIFDRPRAHVGEPYKAVSRGLTMHGDSHSGWSSHDGYPSHYHSAGDVVGLHVRIYKTDGGYDHDYR
jgi:hypothetical protein